MSAAQLQSGEKITPLTAAASFSVDGVFTRTCASGGRIYLDCVINMLISQTAADEQRRHQTRLELIKTPNQVVEVRGWRR